MKSSMKINPLNSLFLILISGLSLENKVQVIKVVVDAVTKAKAETNTYVI